jgi:hypothetical protein
LFKTAFDDFSSHVRLRQCPDHQFGQPQSLAISVKANYSRRLNFHIHNQQQTEGTAKPECLLRQSWPVGKFALRLHLFGGSEALDG